MNAAIEAAARVDKPALWSEKPHVAHMAASPFKLENERAKHLKEIETIIIAFLRNCEVSEGMVEAGSGADFERKGYTGVFKAMAAQLATELEGK